MSEIERKREQIKELEDLLSEGVASMRDGDGSVTYRSASEIREQIETLKDEVAAIEKKRRRRRVVHPKIQRGIF
ncbi:phage head-tail joining protein [Pseudovibrio ascidiaceicola]|uniref:phage head-tail joining protein n=1 Tax=Pseudovibrio ascidiaceicola TaxID=285279 RepID=UPI003D36A33B